MKFSFINLDGKELNGECKAIQISELDPNHALKKVIANSTALSAVLGEFSFFENINSNGELIASGFAVDNENNVFHSDKLPDFVQIGSHWKVIA